MRPVRVLYTRVDYNRLPEGFPAQLVEGQLVREPGPSFGHQRVSVEIYTILRRIVGPGRVVTAPIDVPVDDFNVYQPDVVVLSSIPPDDAADAGIPLLVVEVLSPSTEARDRDVKRLRLLDAGVEEVWLVDRERGSIEVYDRGRYRDVPRRVTGVEPLHSQRLPGFALTPKSLFARPT